MRDLDELRHDVEAKLLVPLPWSPLPGRGPSTRCPTDGREHELTLYMEDTMWPYEDKFLSTSTGAARCTPRAWTVPTRC